ncbi:hypothetical protein ACHAXT_007737 [Thalassiosira profunda]
MSAVVVHTRRLGRAHNIGRCHQHQPSLRQHRRRSGFPAAPLLLQPSTITRCASTVRQELQLQPSAISFLTDVEGDGAYFDRFVRNSKLLEFRSTTPSYGRGGASNSRFQWNMGEWDEGFFPYDKEVVFRDSGDDNSMLVYGGDVWDKGGADLYVLRQLLSLQRRYPNRVHFLMGNRDINKMRIVDELGVGHDADEIRLPRHDGVYWLNRRLREGLPPDIDNRVPSENAAERLKWILRRTMGSVDAFELRRKELARERIAIANGMPVSPTDGDAEGVSVTDEEVAWSYIRSCNPASGIMSQYLARAKLSIRFGPVLYLHGALPLVTSDDESSLSYPAPWRKPNNDDATKTTCASLTEWIADLNAFASDQVLGWREYHKYCQGYPSQDCLCEVWATEGGYANTTLAGEMFGALMQYSMNTLPDRTRTNSCVYNSWMKNGLPREDLFGSDEAREKLRQLFQREGLQVIISGHQPVGDAPWPIQLARDGEAKTLWIIPSDTSFSGDTKFVTLDGFDCKESASLGRGSATSGRGEVAVSETLVQFGQTTGHVESVTMHGVLSDGTRYESNNIMNAGDEINQRIGFKIGRAEFRPDVSEDAKEGTFWVKGKVGDDLLVSSGEGFNVRNAYIKAS